MFLVILLFVLFREARAYNEGLLILHKPARDEINYSFLGYGEGVKGSYLTSSQFSSTLKTTVVDHKMDIETRVFLFFVLSTYFFNVFEKVWLGLMYSIWEQTNRSKTQRISLSIN